MIGQPGLQRRHHQARGDEPAEIAQRQEPDDHSSFAVWRLLDDVGHRADVFAASGQPLEDPTDDEQDRRPDTDGAVRRQQPRPRRAYRHHHDGDHQHPLAPDPITEWAEDEPAEGTHDERRCQRAERGDQVDRADAVAGIKDLRNGGGDVAVDAEVVPLHEVADGRALDGLTRHLGVGNLDLVKGPPAPASSTEAGKPACGVHQLLRYPLPADLNAIVIYPASSADRVPSP